MRDDRQRWRRDHFGNRWIMSVDTIGILPHIDQDFLNISIFRDEKTSSGVVTQMAEIFLKGEEIDMFIRSLEKCKEQLESYK